MREINLKGIIFPVTSLLWWSCRIRYLFSLLRFSMEHQERFGINAPPHHSTDELPCRPPQMRAVNRWFRMNECLYKQCCYHQCLWTSENERELPGRSGRRERTIIVTACSQFGIMTLIGKSGLFANAYAWGEGSRSLWANSYQQRCIRGEAPLLFLTAFIFTALTTLGCLDAAELIGRVFWKVAHELS